MLSVRLKHMEFDSNGVKLTFPEGKTGKRTVRLVYASSFLRNWKDNHPVRTATGEPDPEAYICTSLQANRLKNEKTNEVEYVYRRLSEYGLSQQIQKIADRIGLKKKVNLHAFRHARATDLAEHLTDQQLKQFLGWKPNSGMAAVYIHNPDTENAILRMNGIEIEGTHTDGLKVGRCPRCKEINPETSLYCAKCGLPLTETSAQNMAHINNKLDMEFLESSTVDPALLKLLAKELKNIMGEGSG